MITSGSQLFLTLFSTILSTLRNTIGLMLSAPNDAGSALMKEREVMTLYKKVELLLVYWFDSAVMVANISR